MKKLVFLPILILILLTAQIEVSLAKPPDRGEKNYKFKIGVFGGTIIPLLPTELTDKPTTLTQEIQKSLLNGLDGLGYRATSNIGIVAKCPISKNFILAANFEFSPWKSSNTSFCNDIVSKSDNDLTLLHFGLYAQNFLYERLYISTEIAYNLFVVHVTDYMEFGDKHFSKKYPRIGAGLILGWEIPLSDNVFLDLSAKGQSPNLLPGAEKSIESPISRTIINSNNEIREATLFFLSFNIGILFSL